MQVETSTDAGFEGVLVQIIREIEEYVRQEVEYEAQQGHMEVELGLV